MDQEITITLGMVASFIGFLIVVAAIPLGAWCWKVAQILTQIRESLKYIAADNAIRDKRLDKHEDRLDDYHEQLLRLSRTPQNLSHLRKAEGA